LEDELELGHSARRAGGFFLERLAADRRIGVRAEVLGECEVLQPDRLLWRHVGLSVGEADGRCLLGDRLDLRP
jgi:hypothetical protein